MEAASTTSSTASSVDGRSISRDHGSSGSDFINRGMFASSSSSNTSELLGSGGFASLGNGFGNDNVASSGGTSFDLNDFPSLGGAGSVGSGSGLAAALREQQQLLVHQQMLQGGANSSASSGKGSNLYMLAMTGNNGNFSMANEDFPALGGGLSVQSSPPLNSGVLGGSSASGLNVSSLLTSNVQSSSSSENGPMYGATGLETTSSVASRLEGGAAGLLAGAGLGGLGGMRTSPSAGSTSLLPTTSGTATSTPGAIGTAVSTSAIGGSAGSSGSVVAGSALSGDYGLLGLLGVIRMTDADRNALALGTDLQLMGLNLGSTEQIYGTFSSPWSDVGVAKEPHYQLPMCYYMQPPALKTGHLSKFQLETLFYIFYALPKDVLQAYAAQELYTREWRYHGDLKLWFKRASPSDGVTNSSGGSPQYLYFDINTWERRLFNGSVNQNVTNGFLPEDEVRVKFPSS